MNIAKNLNKKLTVSKLLVGLIVSALLLSLGVGVGLGRGEEKVTLVWGEWWDQEWGRDTIDWIISTFEEEHPNVEVKTVYAPWNQYKQKVWTLCQAGECPDVMGMEVTWAESFDRMGFLKDLKPLYTASSDEFKAHYRPSWLMYWKGRAVMGYLYTMAYSVVYNAKMFREKGIEPPSNWEEFKDVLRAFHDPKAHKFGAALPFAMKSSAHFGYYLFWTHLIQAGGHMVDENGLARFDSPAGVRTLRYLKSLLDEGLVYPGTVKGALAVGEKEFVELFSAEQVPMVITGPFIAPKARERNPEIGEVRYAPPFCDRTCGYLVTGSGTAISAQTKHPDLAWEFYKHLVSTRVAMKMVKEHSMGWANTIALTSSAAEKDPILGPMGKMIANPDSRSWKIIPKMGELFDVLLKHAQQYFLGQKTAKVALDEAAEEWNAIVQEAMK